MKPKITLIPNGPLQLDTASSILFRDGKQVEIPETAYLCRCGLSKNKPFCDGEHSKNNFNSSCEIEDEIIQNYPGDNITIHFNRSICSGAAECVRGLPSVFKSGDGEDWIRPNEDRVENIVATIRKCPSGALSFSIDNHVKIDDREIAKISIVENGPYEVEAVEVTGKPSPTNCSTSKMALCRCGHSKNKPFCDYSHAEKGWKE